MFRPRDQTVAASGYATRQLSFATTDATNFIMELPSGTLGTSPAYLPRSPQPAIRESGIGCHHVRACEHGTKATPPAGGRSLLPTRHGARRPLAHLDGSPSFESRPGAKRPGDRERICLPGSPGDSGDVSG